MKKKNREINIENFYMKHKNIPCVVVGSGHTMHDFDYKNFKGIVIVLGSAIFRTMNIIKPDYLVSANNHMPIPEVKDHRKYINKYKDITWILSDTACYDSIWDLNEENFKRNIKVKYSFFDDRHFKNKECIPKNKCCTFLKKYPDRRMIYDYIAFKFNTKLKTKKQGVSVSDFGITYAILFGCNPIFIQGVDLPQKNYTSVHGKYFGMRNKRIDRQRNDFVRSLRAKFFFYYLKNLNFKPYFDSLIEKIKINLFKKSVFVYGLKFTIIIMKWIKQIAKKKKIKIYVLSKDSTLIKYKIFNYLSYENLQKKYSQHFKT